MSTLAVMTRLQLNFQDMKASGIARAFLFEPVTPIDTLDLPAVYPFQVGRMTGQTPRKQDSAGQYLVERDYGYRMLVTALQAASMDSTDDGAYIDSQACNLIDVIVDYFMQHPRLSTSTLPDLDFNTQDIEVQDSGLVTRPGPGGSQYRAVDYTLIIAERRYPKGARLS